MSAYDAKPRKKQKDARQPINIRKELWEAITKEAAATYRTGVGQLELMKEVYDVVKAECRTDDPRLIRELLRTWREKASAESTDKKTSASPSTAPGGIGVKKPGSRVLAGGSVPAPKGEG